MKYTELINVRLTGEQMSKLRILADEENLSMSDVVRDLVSLRLEEHLFASLKV